MGCDAFIPKMQHMEVTTNDWHVQGLFSLCLPLGISNRTIESSGSNIRQIQTYSMHIHFHSLIIILSSLPASTPCFFSSRLKPFLIPKKQHIEVTTNE